jgi:predicted ArsR family transcriptional regulator
MDIPPAPADDVLGQPIRARLLEALVELRRPATTQELAARVRRHPNSVRVQLARLADAGVLECRRAPQARGRPRQEWAVAPDARPGGQPPRASSQLSQWLARAAGRTGRLEDVEAAGRDIGREIAPDRRDRPVADAMQDALTALGFAPQQQERAGIGGVRYVLANCPYRDAAAQDPAVVCTLHRGITRGMLHRLDRRARLADFVAKDPYAAGCLIDVNLTQPAA